MSLYKYMYTLCKNLELDNYAKGLLELHFQLAIPHGLTHPKPICQLDSRADY